MNHTLEQLKLYYRNWSEMPIEAMASVYAEDVVFEDPIHKTTGLPDLEAYFSRSKTALNYGYFEFIDCLTRGNKATLTWTMVWSHPKLRGGQELNLSGCSILKFDVSNNKIIQHRDYYDVSELLFDHLPILGRLTQFLKTRVAGTNSAEQEPNYHPH
ncbi:MAG: limonene-1,2-epoxide hydrolase [Flavobacteriales bacterium]|jgi:limonene-1,2-epoxide hydrolase